MKYRAVKAYTGAPENPIRIRNGEKLSFVKESNPDGDWPGWIYCTGEGKEGWVPRRILSPRDGGLTATADYDATEHELQPGDIFVADHQLNGWIWSVKQHEPGKWGWAPLNCLEKMENGG